MFIFFLNFLIFIDYLFIVIIEIGDWNWTEWNWNAPRIVVIGWNFTEIRLVQ